jgi:hypothetical protein
MFSGFQQNGSISHIDAVFSVFEYFGWKQIGLAASPDAFGFAVY